MKQVCLRRGLPQASRLTAMETFAAGSPERPHFERSSANEAGRSSRCSGLMRLLDADRFARVARRCPRQQGIASLETESQNSQEIVQLRPIAYVSAVSVHDSETWPDVETSEFSTRTRGVPPESIVLASHYLTPRHDRLQPSWEGINGSTIASQGDHERPPAGKKP